MQPQVDVSIIVPVYNEEESLPVMDREVHEAMEPTGLTWEVIYVDDCSTDGSLRGMLAARSASKHVRIVKFRRNYGQTAAMAAGFDVAQGDIVITLDGDLQNDPADIPNLVEELRKGYDLVAGWRKMRHDGFILRRLPSVIANRLIAKVTGVRIHDTGCTLKAFKRNLVKNLPIYAEQHRFLPVMSSGSGARISEVVVNHRPRRFGHSKYGIGRATRVLLDLMTVKLITQFSQRPLQYFGLMALFLLMASGVMFTAAFISIPEQVSELTSQLGGGLGDADAQPKWITPSPNEPLLRPDPNGSSGLAPGAQAAQLARANADGAIINNWDLMILSAFMLLISLIVYFALLGLLGELVVKASGMHRRAILDRILNELH